MISTAIMSTLMGLASVDFSSHEELRKNHTRSSKSRRETTLGPNEQAIMLALSHRGNHAYGSEINKEIELRTGFALSVGVLYNTIDRLAKKGLIAAVKDDSQRFSEPRPRKVKGRQYFTLTGKGKTVLDASLQFIDRMRYVDDNLESAQTIDEVCLSL